MRYLVKILVSAISLLTLAGVILPPFAGSEQTASKLVPATVPLFPDAESGFSLQRISINEMYHKLPRINNVGSLVWQAKVGEHFQIFYKPFADENPIQLTDSDFDNTDPRLNDQDEIVWMGGDDKHSEIYLYSRGEVTQITATALANRHPKLNNYGEVVWIGGAADSAGKVENFEAFHYAAGVVTQVTDNNKFNVQVRINDAGTMMWRGKGDTDFDIFTRTAGVTAQVTADAALDVNPQLTNDGNMVWERHDGTDDEIVLKLNQDADPVQITTNDTNDCEPQVNDQGTVVWQGYDGSHWQIFMYADGVTTKLSEGAMNHTGPRLNAAGDIAWMVHDTNGIGIAVYQAATQMIVKISGSYIGHYSQMVDLNDQGQVVWAGSNGKNFDVVLATP